MHGFFSPTSITKGLIGRRDFLWSLKYKLHVLWFLLFLWQGQQQGQHWQQLARLRLHIYSNPQKTQPCVARYFWILQTSLTSQRARLLCRAELCLGNIKVMVFSSWWSPCQYNSQAEGSMKPVSTKCLLAELWVLQPTLRRFQWHFFAHKVPHLFTWWGEAHQLFKHWSLPQVDLQASEKLFSSPWHKGRN